MATKRGPLTPKDFVDAAMAFADRQGLAGLSMRALGAELNVDATALYRHFPSKESLLMAMVDQMLGEAVENCRDLTGTPREKILDMAKEVREAFARHPDVGVALVSGEGSLINGFKIVAQLMEYLREIGLEGSDLVVHYQALEQYVLGACVFDYTAAPHHFEIRRARYRQYEMPEFDELSRTEAKVEKIAFESYMTGVGALIDSCERTAAASKKTSRRKK